MSGDTGLHDENETIIFYDEELTETKLVLLSLKGIKLNYEMLRQTKDDWIDKTHLILYTVTIILEKNHRRKWNSCIL